jgi:hypothetical protein
VAENKTHPINPPYLVSCIPPRIPCYVCRHPLFFFFSEYPHHPKARRNSFPLRAAMDPLWPARTCPRPPHRLAKARHPRCSRTHIVRVRGTKFCPINASRVDMPAHGDALFTVTNGLVGTTYVICACHSSASPGRRSALMVPMIRENSRYLMRCGKYANGLFA